MSCRTGFNTDLCSTPPHRIPNQARVALEEQVGGKPTGREALLAARHAKADRLHGGASCVRSWLGLGVLGFRFDWPIDRMTD